MDRTCLNIKLTISCRSDNLSITSHKADYFNQDKLHTQSNSHNIRKPQLVNPTFENIIASFKISKSTKNMFNLSISPEK